MALRPAQVVAYCERALARPTTANQRAVLERKMASAAAQVAAAGTVPCSRCGHPLSDPTSIAAGLGPCCARRVVA